MKALVIAPQPFFSPRGTPFSVYHRILVTTELGVDVDLLTYGQGQDVEIPNLRIIRIPGFRWLGPVKVGPSRLKLFLDVFMALWTVGLLLRHRYDVVHAHEESIFFCRYLKPLFRFKLIYDMHSSLPQQLTNFQFTRSRLLIGTFERLERTCLASADAVITISPDLARHAMQQMPDPSRHALIENCVLDPVRITGSPAATGPNGSMPTLPADRPIVGYLGTLEAYQGIDILIPAFAEAQRRRPDAFLLIVGGTPVQVERSRALVAEHGLADHCLLTGSVDQRTARACLERAEVLVSPRRTGTNTPLKVYELLASGIPIVATRVVSHTQVLGDEVCYLVEPEPRAMAEGMLAALTPDVRRLDTVRRARALYDSSYSREAYKAKLAGVLRAVGVEVGG